MEVLGMWWRDHGKRILPPGERLGQADESIDGHAGRVDWLPTSKAETRTQSPRGWKRNVARRSRNQSETSAGIADARRWEKRGEASSEFGVQRRAETRRSRVWRGSEGWKSEARKVCTTIWAIPIASSRVAAVAGALRIITRK